jgi:hypothetical protein
VQQITFEIMTIAINRWLDWITARTERSVMAIGLLSLTIAAVLSLSGRVPLPAVHDEFSYLLAADTFAHGRLANPTHPMWIHFESMHIIQQPTYASKYPPGQGLMLAPGQVIAGHPIFGVWLSVALACAATCWMLIAWLPPRWALLGGLIVATHPMILHWGQSYWSGAGAMAGGALALGAWRRLIPRPRACDAAILGCGIAILANSRPFEGLVLCLLLLPVLFICLVRRNGPALRIALRRVALPLGLVLLPAAAAMGYYNLRVTGDALRLPYLVHEETYAVAPIFFWQKLRPEPAYRHAAIHDYNVNWELKGYLAYRSLKGLILTEAKKIRWIAQWYFRGWGLLLPLLLLPQVLRRDRWMRLAVLILGLFSAALLAETWTEPHYTAPITALFFCRDFASHAPPPRLAMEGPGERPSDGASKRGAMPAGGCDGIRAHCAEGSLRSEVVFKPRGDCLTLKTRRRPTSRRGALRPRSQLSSRNRLQRGGYRSRRNRLGARDGCPAKSKAPDLFSRPTGLVAGGGCTATGIGAVRRSPRGRRNFMKSSGQ